MTTIAPEHVKELEAKITEWAKDKGFLLNGSLLEISLRIVPRPIVKVELSPSLQDPAKIDASSVDILGDLSMRAQNLLANLNIHTIGELRAKSYPQLRIRNCGRKTLSELQEKLEKLGVIVHWIRR